MISDLSARLRKDAVWFRECGARHCQRAADILDAAANEVDTLTQEPEKEQEPKILIKQVDGCSNCLGWEKRALAAEAEAHHLSTERTALETALDRAKDELRVMRLTDERVRRCWDEDIEKRNAAQKKLRLAEAENADLRLQLQTYGQHTKECDWHQRDNTQHRKPCSCGFEALLKGSDQ